MTETNTEPYGFLNGNYRNAEAWTDEFMRLHGGKLPDAGNMLGWFANAIECQHLGTVQDSCGETCAMAGSNGGFSMAVFEAAKVPVGAKLYTDPISCLGHPIETAKTDGTEYVVLVAEREGLPAFITKCAYHPDAGWCADELRPVTRWLYELGKPTSLWDKYKWHPIETYPQNGEKVLVYVPALILPRVHYIEEILISYKYSSSRWIGISEGYRDRITHWAPMPKPPGVC